MAPVVLTGRIVTGRRVLPEGWVELTDGVVTALGEGRLPTGSDVRRADLVVPGFVDLHCHGGAGEQFGAAGSVGTDAARTVAALHRRHGTTTLVASLVSRPVAELQAAVEALRPLVADGTLAGVHLEGPWLSERFRGAHDPQQLQPPAPADVTRLTATGLVRMVTLAPELEGGLDAVRALTESGVVVAIGHTAADAGLVRAAVDAGARVATHLFNGMPSLHHREPGPVLALLDDDRVTVELIADGVHLDARVVAFAARHAGVGRTALVTDAMAAAGAADGRYPLGGLEVDVVDGVARLVEGGAVAGSTLTLDRALRFAVQEAGLGLDDALAAVTTTPAAVLGRPDVGHLEVGARGGAVLLDADLRVLAVEGGPGPG
ncbi:N-acetylglucosamine-6-phosphate deacetylase [Kineococcus gynurae]|uniref:N-acetylglucosamine-6-phosphate deacetylase n=1 Tax=Kineococcus gynurae TaxID=452979 RepID=A0ABV5LSN0_9ACTN